MPGVTSSIPFLACSVRPRSSGSQASLKSPSTFEFPAALDADGVERHPYPFPGGDVEPAGVGVVEDDVFEVGVVVPAAARFRGCRRRRRAPVVGVFVFVAVAVLDLGAGWRPDGDLAGGADDDDCRRRRRRRRRSGSSELGAGDEPG